MNYLIYSSLEPCKIEMTIISFFQSEETEAVKDHVNLFKGIQLERDRAGIPILVPETELIISAYRYTYICIRTKKPNFSTREIQIYKGANIKMSRSQFVWQNIQKMKSIHKTYLASKTSFLDSQCPGLWLQVTFVYFCWRFLLRSKQQGGNVWKE